MSGEEDKSRTVVAGHQHYPPQYGTFQGVTSSEEDKSRTVVEGHQHFSNEEDESRTVVVGHQHYQGVSNFPSPAYPPPRYPSQYPPVTGFPHPTPPPRAHHDHSSQPNPYGYHTVPGYAVAEGRPVRQRRLPCCGIGLGWFLFIIGFFLGAIPWYIGLFILLCSRIDHREKPGYIACTIAAVLAPIVVLLGATEGAYDW